MAKLRNVSADERHVPLVGRTVAVDEVIEIPDDVYAQYLWPESTWTVVTGPKPGNGPKSDKSEKEV